MTLKSTSSPLLSLISFGILLVPVYLQDEVSFHVTGKPETKAMHLVSAEPPVSLEPPGLLHELLPV